MSIQIKIGERIRIRRKELGLSADDLAQKIGKNRATVYRYESNEIEKMPINVLYPLASALQTTPQALIGWDYEAAIEHKENCNQIPVISADSCEDVFSQRSNVIKCIPKPIQVPIHFAFILDDDSMVGVNVKKGALVYVRKTVSLRDNDIAVLRINKKLTLRKCKIYDDHTVYKAENEGIEPIVLFRRDKPNFEIIGNVFGIYIVSENI